MRGSPFKDKLKTKVSSFGLSLLTNSVTCPAFILTFKESEITHGMFSRELIIGELLYFGDLFVGDLFFNSTTIDEVALIGDYRGDWLRLEGLSS